MGSGVDLLVSVGIALEVSLLDVDTHHRLSQESGNFGKLLRVVVVSGSLNNSLSPSCWISTLEDSTAHENTIDSKLHHQSSISWSGNTTSSEVDNWKSSKLLCLNDQLIWDSHLLGHNEKLVIIHGLNSLNGSLNGSAVSDGLNDATSSGLTLGSDHGSTLGNTSEGFSQISATANKWDAKLVLVDVVDLIGWGKHLTLINVVNTDGLQDLGLNKVTDSGLGHNWNGHSFANFLDHLRITHASHTTVLTDIGWNSLEGHDGNGASLFGDASLLCVDDVHDNTTLEHLGKANLDSHGSLLHASVFLSVRVCVSVPVHCVRVCLCFCHSRCLVSVLYVLASVFRVCVRGAHSQFPMY